MRLTFNSFVVVIFRILTGQAGSRLASWRNLILTFLIRQFVRQSSVRLIGKEARDTAKVVEVVTS